jgi:hypothetical protein
MTLTTHAIAGAAIASLWSEHLVLAPILAFASHFALDMIPHYDYPIHSDGANPSVGGKMKMDKNLIKDALSIGSDGALGMILGILIFATPITFWIVAVCAFCGILPDALQFVYLRIPNSPIKYLQRFHTWIHTKHFLKDHVAFGIISQIIFVIALVFTAKYLAAVMI